MYTETEVTEVNICPPTIKICSLLFFFTHIESGRMDRVHLFASSSYLIIMG